LKILKKSLGSYLEYSHIVYVKQQYTVCSLCLNRFVAFVDSGHAAEPLKAFQGRNAVSQLLFAK